MGEVGKALRHETLSVAGSASTKRTILGEPGPEFTVTAQFSFSPRENPTEMSSMTLLWHLEVQRVKERVCFEVSNLVSLSPSQAVEAAAIFSSWGRCKDDTGLALPCSENPAAPIPSYTLGIQGAGCSIKF